jgi:hypothetical protein
VANKYHAKPVTTDEGRFASQREYQHWCILKLRAKAGEISQLKRQVPFDLIVNGTSVGKYIADAVYFEGQRRVVSDCKGVETPVFKLKSKLMRAIYNVEVELS